MIFFRLWFILAGVSAASVSLSDLQLQNAFMENFRRSLGMPCKDPTPTVVTLKELTSQHHKYFFRHPMDSLYPKLTVLHRCNKGSGACLMGPTFCCGPVQVEMVKLAFLVKDSGSQNIIMIPAVNHTQCGCIEDETDIRR